MHTIRYLRGHWTHCKADKLILSHFTWQMHAGPASSLHCSWHRDDGNVTEYAASIGMTGQWGANGPGLEAFLDLEDYIFWEKAEGVVRAVLPMDFAGVLSYPNPARDYLTIVSSDNIQEIRLINAIGQVVHMQSVDHDRIQLNVAGFDKGLYLVQVLSAKGVSVQRVLITR